MPSKNDKSYIKPYLPALYFLLISFFLAGCAPRPWTDPLAETEADNIIQFASDLTERDSACGNTLDSDLNLVYTNALGKIGFSGYLQFSMPSSFRFVVTNPLGQPFLVVTGNDKAFQAINTMKQKYLAGSLRSFFLLKDIPTFMLSDNWGDWISARNSLSSQQITEIRQDRDQRGVWITFRHQGNDSVQKTHLLLDKANELFLTRLLENRAGKIVAEINYDNWMVEGKCSQPLNIDITGLDYGTSISLRLTDTRISHETKEYKLAPPPGYIRQFMP